MVIDCFAEDVDFPNGVPVSLLATAGTFRPAFARGSITLDTQTGIIKSTTFNPVTSCWIKFQFMYGTNGPPCSIAVIGLGNSVSGDGLYFGCNHGSGTNQSLGAVGIGTCTGAGAVNQLAFTPNIITLGVLYTIDMQVVNYGPDGTVNLYVNGALVLSYTGNLTVGSASNFDSIFIRYDTDNSSQYSRHLSEIVVADESTLGCQGLDLLEITGNGTTQQFNNPAYTNFNPVTINDANSTYSNTAGQDEQAALANSAAGNFAIKAVKIVARANAPAGSAITNLKLGLRNGAGVVGVGAAHALGVGFAPVADILTTDPTTGQPFTSINGYQIDLRSA